MGSLARKMQRAASLKRCGMSLTEALIAIVVLVIALFGIISTLSTSTALHSTARANINARIFASSWFEIFESVNPEPLDNSYTVPKASDYVADTLDANATKSFPQYVINGYRIHVDEVSNTGGFREVKLDVTLHSRTGGAKAFILTRKINARSGETVSDDRFGG